MRYVIYRLNFPNGQFYIGKAKNFIRRLEQHKSGKFGDRNLKNLTVLQCGRILNYEILCKSPSGLSEIDKQKWMDNAERLIIHNEARNVYNKITGKDTNFLDYSFAKDIINQEMVNTQLY